MPHPSKSVIALELWRARPLRQHYWTARGALARLRRLAGKPDFARLAWRDQFRFLAGSVEPVAGRSRERARLAAAWLLRAWRATGDGGVSMGYFPCDSPDGGTGWRPSYPETTGYIITTLLDCAARFDDPSMRERALAMARWEAGLLLDSGAVQAGVASASGERQPAVFNTGMVLQGFTRLLAERPDPEIFDAARRCAGFLLADQGEDGHFRTHGPCVRADRIKTYNVLCAWGLYRFGELADLPECRRAALRAAMASCAMQRDNGWFEGNCLDRPETPLTHTMGYTLQGLLETGVAAHDEALIDSARRGVEPLMGAISPEGFLPARFHPDWRPAALGSCLTGSAQIAIVCYRLHQLLGEARFLEAGERLVDFLKGVQVTDAPDTPMQGGLAGSFPLFLGGYMTAGFPNWATKYLLDALLLQDERAGGRG